MARRHTRAAVPTSLPGKSREPDLTKPTLIALRFRATFGVGACSEILRFLLLHPWPHTAQQIAEEVPYGARQISKDLHLLSLAGMVRFQRSNPRAGYAVADISALVGIVGEPSASIMPWGSIFRVVTALVDALTDLAARGLRDADTEVARRWRLMEKELLRLASEDWWTQPEKATVDDIAAWVPRADRERHATCLITVERAKHRSRRRRARRQVSQ